MVSCGCNLLYIFECQTSVILIYNISWNLLVNYLCKDSGLWATFQLVLVQLVIHLATHSIRRYVFLVAISSYSQSIAIGGLAKFGGWTSSCQGVG